MSQPDVMNQHHDTQETEALVRRVQGMRLRGAVALFVVEGGAIEAGPSAGGARGGARNLGILARQNAALVVVCGVDPAQRDALARAVPPELLEFADGARPIDVTAVIQRAGVAPGACLAVLAMPGARVPDGCHAFYAGPGDPPANAVATRQPGAAAANAILALYGTALAQERAGAAFRATSSGGAIPDAQDLADSIWSGVRRSVERPAAPQPAARQTPPGAEQLRDLARRVYARLLPNLLPNGAVVGSPAHGQQPGEPNYWFFWQRDGAATMARLIALQHHTQFGISPGDLDLPIARYLDFIATTQRNGPLSTSRYQVTGEPVLGFGNPQLDGPALTVLALARVDDATRVWPLVKRYLEFLLSSDEQGRTMNAWEFLYGRSFNATLLRRKALLAGAGIAGHAGQASDAARYQAAAREALDGLAAFEDHATGRLAASRDTLDPWFGAISGVDMAVISALLAVVPGSGSAAPAAPETPGTTLDQLAHPAVLATMAALEDAFAPLYRVNRDWRAGGNPGFGLGRFPEDANDGLGSTGGNPWPLATLWGAQFYYRLAQELDAVANLAPHGLLLRDARQAAFLNRAPGEEIVAVDRPLPSDAWRARLLPALLARGDGYLTFVVHHLPADGGVTEQIDRDTGQPRGAPDLSWALAELLYTIAHHPSA